jgi:hypothetical protein
MLWLRRNDLQMVQICPNGVFASWKLPVSCQQKWVEQAPWNIPPPKTHIGTIESQCLIWRGIGMCYSLKPIIPSFPYLSRKIDLIGMENDSLVWTKYKALVILSAPMSPLGRMGYSILCRADWKPSSTPQQQQLYTYFPRSNYMAKYC